MNVMELKAKRVIQVTVTIAFQVCIITLVLLRGYIQLFQDNYLRTSGAAFDPCLSVSLSIYDSLIIFLSVLVTTKLLSRQLKQVENVFLCAILIIICSITLPIIYSCYHILYILGYIKYWNMGAFDIGLTLYCALMNFKTAILPTIALVILGFSVSLIIGF
jgi:hypothetical protein